MGFAIQTRHEIAMGLLKQPDIAATKRAIKLLSDDALAELKSLVDWVEDYDKHEPIDRIKR